MARTYTLSDVACDSDALNVEDDIVGETSRHQRRGPNDACVATRKRLVDDLELDNSSWMFVATSALVQRKCKVNRVVDPMDLSLAETDEELQAAEQRLNVRRCYTCGRPSTSSLVARCANRGRLLEPRPRHLPIIWYDVGKRRVPVGAGLPTGEELSSVDPLGGSGE